VADKKDAFICYRSYIDAIKVLPVEKRWDFFEKIIGYTLDEVEPAFETDIESAMFTLMKANLDSCDQRFRTSVENGKKGGRPKKNSSEEKPNQKPNPKPNSKPKNNLTENLKKTYQNPNVNVNVNETLIGTSEEGAKAPPPPRRDENVKPFEMDGERYEEYTTPDGERRARHAK